MRDTNAFAVVHFSDEIFTSKLLTFLFVFFYENSVTAFYLNIEFSECSTDLN